MSVTRDSYIDHPNSMTSFPPHGNDIVYRFTRAAKQCSKDDFKSNYEQHKPRVLEEQENAQEYLGLSMWRTPDVAARQWEEVGSLQRYEGLAVVQLDLATGMWFWDDPDTGHVVAWGVPKDFVKATREVLPIREFARAF
jgi:hypothetical protein